MVNNAPREGFDLLVCCFMLFQLYNDGDMIYEMKRRTTKPALLLTQEIFKHGMRYRYGMRGTDL